MKDALKIEITGKTYSLSKQTNDCRNCPFCDTTVRWEECRLEDHQEIPQETRMACVGADSDGKYWCWEEVEGRNATRL